MSRDDVDGGFLVLEVPPLISGSVDICGLKGTPNPLLEGYGGMITQKYFMGLKSKLRDFYPSMLGPKPWTYFYI